MSGTVIPSASRPPPLQAALSGSSVSTSTMPANPPTLAAVSATGAPASGYAPVQMQFRPVASVPPQTGQAFPPMNAPQFRPVPGMSPSLGMGPPNVTSHQSQPAQYAQVIPPPQGAPFSQLQRPYAGPMQVQQQSQPLSVPAMGIVRVNPPPTFTYVPNQNFSVIPPPIQASAAQQAPTATVQPWAVTSTGASVPSQLGQTGQQNSLTVNSVLGQTMHGSPIPPGSDWQEHMAPDGRRYYYNRRTKQSSWEKPFELMTPLERADASTVWKEFTAADGRKYYYNKLTKQSTWTIPEEIKIAREQAQKVANPTTMTVTEATLVASPAPASTLSSLPATINNTAATPATTALAKPSSSSSGTSVAEDPAPADAAEAAPVIAEATALNREDSQTEQVRKPDEKNPENKALATEAASSQVRKPDENSPENKALTTEEASPQDIEEAKKAMPSTGQVNITPLNEDKPIPNLEEATTYANKAEAKNAFRELLESVNVEPDWTWEQAMRLIINDKRYGALKTLGERKQAFNEFLSHRKKQEAEEKRARQKKAREEFITMMQESKELSSKMRWSKVVSLLGDDPRFRAVEREREREELFEDYIVELEAKEKERAREERKRNVLEYRKFLESCDFIRASTQWRKVADRLEDDERCSRLSKNDRIDIFQEYIHDLEKAEEEERKLQKEQQRRKERKNRDDFRKLMEEHRASGLLNARVGWRDYSSLVKDNPIYLSVCSNTSGSTAKELFEDVAEDMDKQYAEDKTKIRDFLKSRKTEITSEWTFEKFKSTVAESSGLTGIVEFNLKFVFDDLLERAREKEEKETKKRKRAADDFVELLHTQKSISSTSTWEDYRTLLENTVQFRVVDDETICKKMFNEYVSYLQQKTQEKDKKREEEKERRERGKEKEKDKDREKSKEKDRKEKERDKEKSSKKDKEVHIDEADVEKNNAEKDELKKEKHGEKNKHRDKKHKKHHRSKNNDDMAIDQSEKDEAKKSRRHNGEKKKSSRKHGHEQSSDAEYKHKRHRREHEKENGRPNDLEDGELGEDGERS